MMETINQIAELVPNWAEVITLAIALAGAIAVATPSKNDNKVLGALAGLVNVIGLNFGKAKNADAKTETRRDR